MEKNIKIGDRIVNIEEGGLSFLSITELYNGIYDTHFRLPTEEEIKQYYNN